MRWLKSVSLLLYICSSYMVFPGHRLNKILEPYNSCSICPRNCNVNRFRGETGICGSDAGFNISSICRHQGEEPAISGVNGICNIFFSRCNLSCIYCQNFQISSNSVEVKVQNMDLDKVTDSVINFLDQGCHAVGFVSPSHHIPHVKAIIEALRFRDYHPVFVYNTNAYDKVEEIRNLEEYIDIYLPDYKYSDNSLARKFSKVADYQQTAFVAIKEMFRQKGSTLVMNENNFAERGMIIRHLVLPGYVENSIKVLQDLAEISTSLTISLMAQYWPTPAVKEHPSLGRKLQETEYEAVRTELEKLGFYKGWVQDIESSDTYRPDFETDTPFR